MYLIHLKVDDTGMQIELRSEDCLRNALMRLGDSALAGSEALRKEMLSVACDVLSERPVIPPAPESE